jgi:hypothetical protein
MKQFFFFILVFSFCGISFSVANSSNPNSGKCPNGGGKYCIDFQEPIGKNKSVSGKTGLDLLKNYLSIVYKYGASIIGIVAVLIIVASGIQIMMGGVDADMVSQAKTRILQAILSLVILFLSAAILVTVNPGFFGK